MDEKRNLFGFSRKELESCAVELGLPAFRGRQLYRWIYSKSATDVDSMTDLPRVVRGQLAESFIVRPPELLSQHRSQDGTVKFLFSLEGGNKVEAVYIPDHSEDRAEKRVRHTICLSTQIGCPLKCTFCYSGTVPFARNLTVGEILGQFQAVRDALLSATSRVNVVFMGMGEPLDNIEATAQSIGVLTDPHALSIVARHITVSTVGTSPDAIWKARDLPVCLAWSLHTTNDELRRKLVPTAKHSVLELRDAFVRVMQHRDALLFVEMTLIDSLNDSNEQASELADFLAVFSEVRVNLVPLNPGREGLAPSGEQRVLAFQQILRDRGYFCAIRQPRGLDENAACGQLAASG